MRYVVHLWVRGEHIDSEDPKGISVHLAASSETNKNESNFWAGCLHDVYKRPSPCTGTFDWQELAFTFDTPAGTHSMIVQIDLRGAGTLWIDDFAVIPLEKSLQVESY
jgi:hypothetical protein